MNTQRTELEACRYGKTETVSADFARQLETECAELRRYLEHALENVNVDTSCDVCQEARAILAKVPK